MFRNKFYKVEQDEILTENVSKISQYKTWQLQNVKKLYKMSHTSEKNLNPRINKS